MRVISIGILITTAWTAAAVEWDILDETYGSGSNQQSFVASYVWPWTDTPSETLHDGFARLVHGSGYDYAVRFDGDPSFAMPTNGPWGLEIRLHTHDALGATLYLGDNADPRFGTIITLNHLYSETSPHPHTIGDYNRRVTNETNIAEAGFDGAEPHTYYFNREVGGPVSLFVDGVLLGTVTPGAGAPGDGAELEIGFGGGLSPGPGTIDVYRVRASSLGGPPPSNEVESAVVQLSDVLAMRFQSRSGSVYRLESAQNDPSTWENTPMTVIGSGELMHVYDEANASGSEFFRLVENPGPVLDVGSERQLFIDDLFIAASSNLNLRLHPPQKTGEHILVKEEPWESATLNWFNVMKDGAVYRMWYECYDIDGWPTGDDTSFCYAESSDGINWNRPNLGLFTYQGSTNNNILFRMVGPPGAHSRVHGTGVFKDPAAPPGARYKAVSQGLFATEPFPHNIAGMYSGDGLVWTRYPDPVCRLHADSQYSCFWDEQRGTYMLYGRVGGYGGRAVGHSPSADFTQFETLSLVLQADPNDPPNSDIYNPAALKYPYAEDVYLMFPSLYQHDPDTLDIRLAVSRNGSTWTWPEQSVPYIPLSPTGTFDSATLYMGQGLVREGDELWLYYSGSPLKHQEGDLPNLIIPGNERVYTRVVSRLDGFVSVDAGPGGGFFTTPQLQYAGDELQLNVAVGAGGSVRVGLLDGSGNPVADRGVDDCIPITGDDTSLTVAWQTGTDVAAHAGQPTAMRVEMVNASLYAFQFTAAP